ncbi:MAG: DUF4926 domain-containing protein [Thermomicrobiales bacterium]
MEELDTVALAEPLSDHGLAKGAEGVVVMVYGNHEAYEVEFLDGPRTVALVTLMPDQVRLVHRFTSASTAAAAR